MPLIYDSYRSFALLRMTTKRKRVILNGVKNLYKSTADDISIVKLQQYKAVGAAMPALPSLWGKVPSRRFCAVSEADEVD